METRSNAIIMNLLQRYNNKTSVFYTRIMSSDDTTEICIIDHSEVQTTYQARLQAIRTKKKSKSGQHTWNDIAQFLSSRFILTHIDMMQTAQTQLVCRRVPLKISLQREMSFKRAQFRIIINSLWQGYEQLMNTLVYHVTIRFVFVKMGLRCYQPTFNVARILTSEL